MKKQQSPHWDTIKSNPSQANEMDFPFSEGFPEKNGEENPVFEIVLRSGNHCKAIPDFDKKYWVTLEKTLVFQKGQEVHAHVVAAWKEIELETTSN